MNDNSSQPNQLAWNADAKKPLTGWGILWRGMLICFTLFVIVVTAGSFWFLVQRQHYVRQLSETVEKIRTAGGPLEADEIEDYYSIPPGAEDLTAEYLQALLIFQKENSLTPEQLSVLPYVGSWEKPLVGPDWDHRQVATDYLLPFQPSLDQFRALAQRTGSVRYPVKMADNIAALLPNVQALRNASRHLSLDFDLALLAGDRERALADLHAMLKAGETLKDEPILISHLVRIAMFGMFAARAEAFLADGTATDEELKQLDTWVSEVDFRLGLKRAFTGERAMSYLATKTLNTREINSMGSNGNSETGLPGFGKLHDMRPGDVAVLLKHETEMIAAAELEFPEVLQEMDKLDAELKAQAEEQVLPWNKNILIFLFAPAVTRVASATARSIGTQESLRGAIAVERFHLQMGKRPAALAELVPDFLPAVPVDPYTGRQLIYVVNESDYEIYSAGENKLDDGGPTTNSTADIGVRIRTQPAAEPTE